LLYVGLGIVYLFLLFFLGLRTIQNKHWILFAIGIFIPLVWIVGAMMPPKGMSHVDELYAQKERSA
jgi:ABC-type multidrug transport system permease subunit